MENMKGNTVNLSLLPEQQTINWIINDLLSKIQIPISSLPFLELSLEEFLLYIKPYRSQIVYSYKYENSILRLYFDVDDLTSDFVDDVLNKLRSNSIFNNLVESFYFEDNKFEFVYSFSFLTQKVIYNRSELIKAYLNQQEYCNLRI